MLNTSFLLVLLVMGAWVFAITRPSVALGSEKGLAPCPKSPNCVCSGFKNGPGYIDPLSVTGLPDPIALVEQILLQERGMKVVKRTESYLHVEVRSRVLRFVDDLEVLLDPEAGLLHFRSASRVGYYDFGANGKRVERLKGQIRRVKQARGV